MANIKISELTAASAALGTQEFEINDSGTSKKLTGSQLEAFVQAGTVLKTSTTGSAVVPSGTTAEQDGSPQTGYLRFNTTDSSFEGYDGSAWGSIGGGATADAIYENSSLISNNITIATGRNGMSTGPISVDAGVTVTVSDGARYVVI
jgi:hypothetical protein